MADDIDIEEHDVLEHLRSRGLGVVKAEPLEYDDDESAMEAEEDAYEDYYEKETDNTIIEPNKYRQFNNKIILGSKPKPAPQIQSQRNPEIDEKVFNSFVLLEDWGERLCYNKCYCDECEILFPTRNVLDAHKMVAHSFLVARPSQNVAIKSTAKAQGSNVVHNVAKKSTTDPARFCNHCKLSFNDNTALIKHLYEHLPAKIHECSVCDDVFDTIQQLDEHQKNHTAKTKKKSNKFCCPVCFCFFKGEKRFKNHCKVCHGRILESKKGSIFTGNCPFCPCSTSSAKYYQRHLSTHHPEHYKKKVNTSVIKNIDVSNIDTATPLFFHCNICSCYYTSIGSYRKHMNRCHGCKPPLPIRRDGFNKNCKFCHSTFESTIDYNAHIRSEHLSIYRKISTIDVQSRSKRTKFKCRICNKILLGKTAAHHHRASHPESKQKKQMTKPMIARISRINYPMTFGQSRSTITPFIPQALFKCNNCPIHFLISHTAHLHMRRGCMVGKKIKCQLCKREFRQLDHEMHMAQHELTEKVKVYTINPNLYNKIICQCQKCKVFFDEELFWREHSYQTCGRNLTIFCKLCKRNIYGGCFKKHLDIHTQISANEFITITYAPQKSNQEALKRKMADGTTEVASKKAKNSFNFYYYCNMCKSYFTDSSDIRLHIDQCCDTVIKTPCSICGLVLPTSLINRHKAKHSDLLFEPIKNGTFICIQDMKEIRPPVPEYPKCKNCNVSFIGIGHRCGEKQVKCNKCDVIYNEYTYKVHNNYHPKVDNDDIPALLKKYLSIQPLWNIMFQCESCDVVTDTYDQVVEHSQMHFNGMEKCDVFRCGDCELTFHSTCYARHCQLHTDYNQMNRDSFKIIKYSYKHLAKLDECLSENGSLTPVQIEQITSRSVYKYCKCIKFDIIQKSDPECTLFKCGRCLNCIDPQGLIRHVMTKPCSSTTVLKCTHCSLTFESKHVKTVHENQHGSVSEFGMVIFNSEKDNQFNKAIQEKAKGFCDSVTVSNNKTVSKKISQTMPMKNEQIKTMYQCVKCKMCLAFRKSASKHKCQLAKKARCSLCKNIVSKYKMQVHLGMHVTHAKFNFVPFANQPSGFKILTNVPRVVKLYKCSCGLHFMSEQSIQNHYPQCGDDSISKEKCSKCSLLFPTNALVSHLCNHHTDKCKFNVIFSPNSSKSNEKIVLYRCGKCDLHYNSTKAMDYHFCTNHIVKYKITRCSYCKLRFPQTSCKSHMRLHQKKTFKLSDIHIVSKDGRYFPKVETKLVNDSEDENVAKPKPNKSKTEMVVTKYNKIYKCSECACCFLSCKSHLQHVTSNSHYFKEQLAKCKVCGLRFKDLLLMKRHYSFHHRNMGLTAEQLRVLIRKVGTHRKRTEFQTFEIDDLGISSYDDDDEEIGTQSKKIFTRKQNEKTYSRKRKLDDNVTISDDEEASDAAFEVPKKLKVSLATSYEKDNEWKVYLKSDSKSMARNIRKSNRDSFKADRNPSSVDAMETGDDKKSIATNEVTLHQCGLCKFHFMTENSVHTHMTRNRHWKENEGESCEFCGLKFSKVTLQTHISVHHKNGDLKNIEYRIMKYCDTHRTKSSGNMSGKTGSGGKLTEQNEGVKLYQCELCYVHFITDKSLKAHASLNHSQIDAVKCDSCSLMFTKTSLDAHVNIHHKRAGDNLDPKEFNITTGCIYIVPFDGEQAPLYKCMVCFCHFVDREYLAKHMASGNHISENDGITCKKCGLLFPKGTIDNHYFNHHQSLDLKREDFKIIEGIEAVDKVEEEKQDVSQSSKDEIPSKVSPNNSDVSDKNKLAKKYKLKLYKCGECNVYFMTQAACYKHSSKHVPIDPMEYIECKICSFQFNYATLHIHMKNHHFKQNFNLEDLLVEEYRPAIGNDVPKIDIYCAIDRVQSRLVSTTTEDAQEPSSSRDVVSTDNYCESAKETDYTAKQDELTNANEIENKEKPITAESETTITTIDTIQIESDDESEKVENSKVSEISKECESTERVEKDKSKENTNIDTANSESVKLSCKFCGQLFKSRTSLGLHESIEHSSTT